VFSAIEDAASRPAAAPACATAEPVVLPPGKLQDEALAPRPKALMKPRPPARFSSERQKQHPLAAFLLCLFSRLRRKFGFECYDLRRRPLQIAGHQVADSFGGLGSTAGHALHGRRDNRVTSNLALAIESASLGIITPPMFKPKLFPRCSLIRTSYFFFLRWACSVLVDLPPKFIVHVCRDYLREISLRLWHLSPLQCGGARE
jgi:hypothetical protein